MHCVQNPELHMHLSPSNNYPAGKLQWHFNFGFDFRDNLWLPFLPTFAVLKGLIYDKSYFNFCSTQVR